jgi:hypothetical protein
MRNNMQYKTAQDGIFYVVLGDELSRSQNTHKIEENKMAARHATRSATNKPI